MNRSRYLVPAAIIIGGLVLALAIYTVRTADALLPKGDLSYLRPITPDEHLIGSPEASLTVITYSDIDCTYCKEFEATMTQLMTEYAPGGEVAWVYRHFPIVDLHPHAATHAEAAECVASLGGTTVFFRFIDLLHQSAPGSIQFDPQNYDEVLGALAVSEEAFNECMESDRFVAKIADDYNNALDIGADGTPFTVLVKKGGDTTSINGALPYTSMKEVIDATLLLR